MQEKDEEEIPESNFTIAPYGYKVKLVLCDDVAEYIVQKELFEESDRCKAIVLDFENDETVKYNCLVIFSCKSVKIDLIAHEAFHIACLIARSRGFKLTKNSEECYAYLVGYISRVLFLKLTQLKQKKYGCTDKSEEIPTSTAGPAKMEEVTGAGIIS